ncbi:hypothetical protein DV451_004384 [Geotrichum candidum]|uniref:rRNA-processing protein EFG1 n=1 Tax=Geotrichum candidum TaxID=1173061 RepID=A0A0J9X4M5_GEOCN|nr:hypothetical protein DV451_004384 [Geotrichum candidum]KAI9210360.1 hypothetical protein DS838_004763 [Geotrichum bryndzae]KAF5112616.1 hypothetical protein DV454_004113 [Geotrichum candidum]KAF5116753.1 hypothetical protein DV452_002560 [Geotrichum candidum]KAF5119646.1 hypothetical protein DV495_004705 [Geotrichum candidum]
MEGNSYQRQPSRPGGAQKGRRRNAHNKIKEVHALKQGVGSSKLKKKIRDVERTLRKPGLAATKKLESERALAALREELEDVQRGQKAKENAQRYHMVRFFERKKAARKLKQAVKAILGDKNAAKANDSDDSDKEEEEAPVLDEETLRANLEKAEIDLYYTVLFPLERKYISLYPSSDANDAETLKARKEFWEEIKVRVKSGELPTGINSNKTNSRAVAETDRIRKEGVLYKNLGKNSGTSSKAYEDKTQGETAKNNQKDDAFFAN